MSTTHELIAHRATAGARYLAAVIELRAAWGDLAAIERVLMNDNVRGGSFPTFGPPPEIVPLRHPTYAPNISGSFVDDLNAALATRMSAWPTPDPEE